MKRERKIRVWRVLAFAGLLSCLLFGVRAGAQTRDANTILDKAAAAYEGSKGISATFAMSVRSNGQRVGEEEQGTIQMRGDKFFLSVPGTLTWFDGTTQWSYVERNEEVNVTNPTGDELRFTNPALLLRTYREGFSASLTGESTAPNGKAAYDVELTPSKKADVTKVRLQIEKYSGFPASITVEAKNGVSTTVRISQLKTGVNQADDVFVFPEADYPDAEVIDLR